MNMSIILSMYVMLLSCLQSLILTHKDEPDAKASLGRKTLQNQINMVRADP